MVKYFIPLIALTIVSCSVNKYTLPEPDKMIPVHNEHFLKNYTKEYLNTIPVDDLNLITKDTIIIIYKTTEN